MGNHTKKAAIIEASRDSKIFSNISPSVFQATVDVMPALVSVLNWEPLAGAFLIDVIRQVSLEGDPLTMKHAEFARVLWGNDVSKVAGERRIGRCVSSLKKCQLLSGLQAIWVESGRRFERGGELEYTFTTYRLRDFFTVFGEIQKLALEQDMMSLPKKERRITQLAIVQSVCDARQYQRLPARARVASAPAIADKAAARVRRVEESAREPNDNFEKWLIQVGGEYYKHLLATGDTGEKFRERIKSAHAELVMAEQSAQDLIIRTKAPGLRLMKGGRK